MLLFPVDGDFSFFRRLDFGSDGPDVLQLERILSESGYDVGTVDQLFTEETSFGLRDWQIARGYGGAQAQNPTKIFYLFKFQFPRGIQ
ncbi:MAG: hypothetical protein Ct9H90mP5_05430 [Acidimicrobiaceae bacterium]|nr:MAG: hypothetical protein Ct9H90mP5_05430 [Acidimicrobiaceae bacterium]